MDEADHLLGHVRRLLRLLLRLDGRPELPVDRRQAGQRADHHHGHQRDDLHLARVPPGGVERHAHRRGAAADGRGQGRQGPGLAGPGLHGTDLPGHRDGRADGLGHRLQGAARAAGQPRLRAEPRQGAVVLPGPAGNARLLRPVDGRRRLSRPDHRRA